MEDQDYFCDLMLKAREKIAHIGSPKAKLLLTLIQKAQELVLHRIWIFSTIAGEAECSGYGNIHGLPFNWQAEKDRFILDCAFTQINIECQKEVQLK